MSALPIFEVLAVPSRRRIVELLAEGRKTVGEINQEFEISGPAVSQHLRVLRESGLVEVEVDAQRRIYRLRQEPLDEMQAWLDQIRSFWTDRLDALERELKKENS